MKVKNIMFFGFAAAILSTAAANAAATTNYGSAKANESEKNIVTSKYYVDTNTDALRADIAAIPAANNATITVKAGDTTVTSFTVDQSSNANIELGTAVALNSTSTVEEDGTGLPTAGAVYTYVGSAISGAAGDYQVASQTANQVSDGNGSWKALGTTLNTAAEGYEAGNAVTAGTIVSALSGKQDTLTFDNAPTENSTNPVKSGGVYTALAGKEDTSNKAAAIVTTGADANITSTDEYASTKAVYDYVQTQTGGVTIPSMPGTCTGKNCALVAQSDGSMAWIVMAGN